MGAPVIIGVFTHPPNFAGNSGVPGSVNVTVCAPAPKARPNSTPATALNLIPIQAKDYNIART
jgi:hypothetical protein